MKDIVIVAVLTVVLVLSIGYIIKAKKNGVKCIGCPASKECGNSSGNSSCSCGCSGCNTDAN